jgi:hypothetical protein
VADRDAPFATVVSCSISHADRTSKEAWSVMDVADDMCYSIGHLVRKALAAEPSSSTSASSGVLLASFVEGNLR